MNFDLTFSINEGSKFEIGLSIVKLQGTKFLTFKMHIPLQGCYLIKR